MLSRNPNLKPSEIEDILHSTSLETVYVSDHLNMKNYFSGNFLTPKSLVNAKQAVEEAIKRYYPGQPINKFEAKKHIGYFIGSKIRFNNGSEKKLQGNNE